VDHLVFALHAHTVLFLGLGIGLIEWRPLHAMVSSPRRSGSSPPVHRFYRSGWVETVLKTVLLGVVYFFLLVLGILLTTAVALLGT